MRLPQQSRQKYASTATMLFQGKDNNNNNKQIPKGTHPYDNQFKHWGTVLHTYQHLKGKYIPGPQLRPWSALSTASQTQRSTYLASLQVLAQQSCTASRSKTCHTCLSWITWKWAPVPVYQCHENRVSEMQKMDTNEKLKWIHYLCFLIPG